MNLPIKVTRDAVRKPFSRTFRELRKTISYSRAFP